MKLFWPIPIWFVLFAMMPSIPGGPAENNIGHSIQGSERHTGQSNVFSVFGQIKSSDGVPMSGVSVRVSCGIGTLFCTGKTQSKSDGQYRVEFGPGVLFGSKRAGSLGVGLQAATVSAQKPGYSCVDLGRAGNLAMSDLDKIEPGQARGFVGVVRPGLPYHLDFVLLPTATIKGRLVSAKGDLPPRLGFAVKGKVLPPSSSVLTSISTQSDGTFTIPDVPVGTNWWFETDWGQPGQWKRARSEEFSCPNPSEYHVNVTWAGEDPMKMEWEKTHSQGR